jgi:hypothetical protein
MRDYTFRYTDASGRTGPTDFIRFADDVVAMQFGTAGLALNAVVEVWRGRTLVGRLSQPLVVVSPIASGTQPGAADT